ncbi:hypothetical protein EGW08_023037 [Elysia chlorotica]|uniref:Protein NO VEIN C-terminal domain-containing protein n=1 Tax=Elysia chlorotica TaxID=188477 RepID=A0A3S1GZG2_ELYCH|nr:hypothetical protein EGW08_023037 [Elysia chlorotica]
MVNDNMFYLHQAYSSSQTEINREIAKHFSSGNRSCSRELMNFLTQAVPILEGKSNEPMESLLSRQQVAIRELPSNEVVWEVPLPQVKEPEPEPEPEPQDSQMVYGRGLDSDTLNQSGAREDAQDQNEGIKSWPPRSALNIDENMQRPKKDSEKSKTPAGMWPPPRPPNSDRSAKTLPSNIRVERDTIQEHEGCAEKLDGEGHRKDSLSRQSSHSRGAEGSSTHGQSAASQQHEGDGTGRKQRGSQGTNDEVEGNSQRNKAGQEQGRGDGTTNRQGSGLVSQLSVEELGSGEKRKRKASESLRDGEHATTKRFNSQMDETSDKESDTPPSDRSNSNSGPGGQGHKGRTRDSSDQEPSDSSSCMDVTFSSSSASQDSHTKQSRERRGMHFTIPLWSESNQNLEYTDLSKDISPNLPGLDLQVVEHEQTEQILKIGRWGEMLVLDYLIRLKDVDPNIEAVLWANAEGEKGLPWDFEIVYLGTQGLDNSYTVYIEVKTTVTQDREIVEISPRQLELALKEGPNFQVYRVYGAGKPEPRLLRIENVAERMKAKQLKLYMVL